MDAPSCAYEIEELFYKWQAERSFTLEQISKEFIGENGETGYFDEFLDYRIETKSKITFQEWFEQFKK